MKGLTRRQQEALEVIREFIRSHQHSPAYHEIMQLMGLRSVSAVAKLIQKLKERGYLQEGGLSAARELLPIELESAVESSGFLGAELPVIAFISREKGIEIFANFQSMAIPYFMIYSAESTYLLRVKGKGFEAEMISEGDVIVLEGRSEALDGEQVLFTTATIPTSIREYHAEGLYARLVSRSEAEEPYFVKHEDLEIHGIVSGVLRLNVHRGRGAAGLSY